MANNWLRNIFRNSLPGVGDVVYESLFPNKAKEEQAKKTLEQTKTEEKQYIDERQKKQDKADQAINDLFENYPELADNQQFIDQLNSQLQAQGKTLQNVLTRTQELGGTYLDQLATQTGQAQADLQRSEQAARTGLERSTDIYRNLAKKRTLPGQNIIEGQLGETTANALSQIRSGGGGRGLSAITDIYNQELANRRGLGVQAANFQTQNLQNLAGAEAQAGTTMSDIIARNAVTGSNLSSQLYGAQSDYLNRLATAETNIAQNQGNVARTMYDVNTQNKLQQYQYNQLQPTQQRLSWEQAKYQINDPFAARLQVFGEDKGFAYAQMQNAIQQQNENRRALMSLGTEAIKGVATGGLSLPGSLLNFGNNANQTSTVPTPPSTPNYYGAQNYLQGNEYNPVNRYYPQ